MEKQCFCGETRESKLLGTGSAPARSTIGHCRDRSSGRHGGECARTVASAPVSTCRREAPSGRQSRVEQCRRPDGRSVDCRRCTRRSSRCSTPLQSSPFPTEYFSSRCEARSWRCVLRLIVVGFCCRSSLFPTITTGFYSRMNTQNTRCSFPHPPPQSAGATSIPRSPRSTGRPAHTRPQRHRPTDDGDATDPTSRICSHVMSWSSSKAEDHVARSILTGRIHDGQRCSVRRVICGNYHFAENGIHVFREIVRYKSGDERCLSHARYASQSASNPTVSHHNDSDCFGHTNKHFCKLNNLYTLEK